MPCIISDMLPSAMALLPASVSICIFNSVRTSTPLAGDSEHTTPQRSRSATYAEWSARPAGHDCLDAAPAKAVAGDTVVE